MTTKQEFHDTLRTLSEASVEQNFDAFTDIDWDNPDYEVDPHDPRWKLPRGHVLGSHEWYLGLPEDEQIRVGLYLQANVTKVGLQFEQILISGVMNYLRTLPNGSPEFRYATHEVTEECHHTQMFQEFVNRSGADVAGGSAFFRAVSPILPLAGSLVPFGFFMGVLAGEEPIDHMQKAVLRAGDDMHPLLQRIMQIHVAEEARHIGFAHQFLSFNAPRLNVIERPLLAILTPVIMRWLCDEIIKPSKQARQDIGLPDDVFKEVYWTQPASEKVLRDLFADVRMLTEDIGLMNPVSRRIWKLLKIDGRPARFRGEPASAAA
ncbi:MAG: diiron oxygenase [Nocardioides sp.]|uniref:AurF N-oxygenase family protein n=1 Tax=Nocardioides sp. TaxID=35761 RepID=UPI0032658431